MSVEPRSRSSAAPAVRSQKTKVRPALSSPIPKPPAVAPVTLNGTFADSTNVVVRTIASLHLATGRLEADADREARKVLVAFAEMRLGGAPVGTLGSEGEDEHDPKTLFTTSMPLENLAFVLLDLTVDLKRICDEVVALRTAELAVDPDRMAGVRYFVAHLERQARSCRKRLDDAYGVPTTQEDADT